MIDRKLRMKTSVSGMRMLAALTLLMTTWLVADTSVSAEGTIPLTIAASSCDGSGTSGSCWNETGAKFSVTTEDGEFLGSCTLGGPPDIGVLLSCTVPVPDGSIVVVTEDVSTITPDYVPEENPIIFDTSDKPVPPNVPSFWGPIFHNAPQSGSVSNGQTSDVAIATVENGQAVTDACYVLIDFSNEGCDENGDGQVIFMDVPVGTYTVHQTADLGPGRSVSDFTIQVRGNINSAGFEEFPASVSGGSSETASPGGSVDIALITRDPQDGHLLTGTCYVLVGYSNEGCDENGDGQVTFAAIPYGTYTVHQTQTPVGYPNINDYAISVQPTGYMEAPSFGVPLGFIVKQAPDQNASNTRNVSVVVLDMQTHEKVTTGVCVELIGASNVGCDEDLVDGQIDFLDVPAGGSYELRFSNLPAGAQVGEVGGPLAVTIDAGPGSPSNVMVFVLLDMPDSGSIPNSDSSEATILMTFRGCPDNSIPTPTTSMPIARFRWMRRMPRSSFGAATDRAGCQSPRSIAIRWRLHLQRRSRHDEHPARRFGTDRPRRLSGFRI